MIQKIGKWVLILAFIAFLFANPITRSVILFLLPLGRGLDDLIEIIAIVGLIVLLLAKGWIRLDLGPVFRAMRSSPRFAEVVLALVVVGILLLVPYTGTLIWGLFLYGTPIVDPTFFVILGVAVAVMVIGWLMIRRTR